MSQINPWEEVVWKLVHQTEAGELRWQPAGMVPDPVGERQVGPAYAASVGGQTIRIYEYESIGSVDGETQYPVRDVAIGFVNEEGQTLWSFPGTEARWKLWNAIRYQAVNVDQFLERFLRAS